MMNEPIRIPALLWTLLLLIAAPAATALLGGDWHQVAGSELLALAGGGGVIAKAESARALTDSPATKAAAAAPPLPASPVFQSLAPAAGVDPTTYLQGLLPGVDHQAVAASVTDAFAAGLASGQPVHAGNGAPTIGGQPVSDQAPDSGGLPALDLAEVQAKVDAPASDAAILDEAKVATAQFTSSALDTARANLAAAQETVDRLSAAAPPVTG